MFLKKLFYTILFLSVSFAVTAQGYYYTGYVLDATTKEPLPYANVWVPALQTGTVCGEKGKFTLIAKHEIDSIRVSYMGYKTMFFRLQTNKKPTYCYIEKQDLELNEIHIRLDENPAHRIVRLVNKHIKKNNPYYYPTYKLKQYSKTLFSSEIVNDSIARIIFLDSLGDNENKKELYETLQKQHFFLSESVIERNYKHPNKNNDILLASKTSGFKDPFFQVIINQVQSFSFYDKNYTLLVGSFKNPIYDNTFTDYFFWIEDTTYVGKDTLFTISFAPRKGKEEQAITGYMIVHSEDWAIQSMVASPCFEISMFTFVIEQHYEKVDEKYWFPMYTFFKLNFQFDKNFIPITTYTSIRNKEIQIGIPQRNIQFISDEIYTESIATYEKKSDSILAIYRDEPISSKDMHTYEFWDTIEKDIDIDKGLFMVKTLLAGEISLKWINLKLEPMLKISRQETVRLGIGLETNDRLTEYFRIGGFFGYGFKDKKCKWGLNSRILLHKRRKIHINLHAAHDLVKAGSSVESRTYDSYTFSISKINNALLVSKKLLQHYDYNKQADISISGLINNWLEGKISLSYNRYQTAYAYQFAPLGLNHALKPFSYDLAELSCFLKINSYADVYTFGNFNLRKKTLRPELIVRYSRGIKGLFESDFAYNRLDIKILHTIKIKHIGDFTYLIRAGYIDRDLPYSALYSFHGAWLPFDIYDNNSSFSTMRVDEFVSDTYISLFLSQNFPLLYKTNFSAPYFQALFNMGWGNLRHPEYHQGESIVCKTMHHGYYEAGINIHDLYSKGITKIGCGVFYRLGPYRLPETMDNLSFHLSFSVLGL